MKPAKPTSAPRSAFGIGVLRTVRGSLKRFVALATICALGVTMICGLKVACIDLRASADAFFDAQDLFDLRIQSTLGLTDDDVDALAAIDGVEAAEGGWVETCYTTVGSSSEKVDVKALSPSGMNQPRVLDLQRLGPNLTLVTLRIDGTLQARSTRRGIVAFPATRPKETP